MYIEKPSKQRPFLPVKYDIIFRLFFADERNEDDLIDFLKSILRLPDDEYQSIEIVDPHLLPEYIGDKYAVIDIKLHTRTRKVIHIEVQLQVPPSVRNRIVFYNSKLITEQIGSGDQYSKIQKAITIVITGESFIPNSDRYFHRFAFADLDAGVEFSDLKEIYTLELGKLPPDTDGTAKYDWAKFIDAETEEELDMVSNRNPQIKRAAVKLRELSADEKARDMFERREKGRRDVEAFADGARLEGRAEGRADVRADVARNAIEMGMNIDTIIKLTSLTREEIEALNKAD
jgi:predicted transposase/invertase (TIGR01784 family)